jgi:hypothetical protein
LRCESKLPLWMARPDLHPHPNPLPQGEGTGDILSVTSQPRFRRRIFPSALFPDLWPLTSALSYSFSTFISTLCTPSTRFN